MKVQFLMFILMSVLISGGLRQNMPPRHPLPSGMFYLLQRDIYNSHYKLWNNMYITS